MTTAVLAGSGVLLVAAVVVADRLLVVRAERCAAGYLAAPFGDQARIRVGNRPFLPQLVRGRYAAVVVTAENAQLGRFRGVQLQAQLSNARLPLHQLLARRAGDLPVEHLAATALIPYPELARISPLPGIGLRHQDGRMVAEATLPVPGLGQLTCVSGAAVASVGDDGTVWLRLRDLAVAGIPMPGVVLNQLVAALAVPVSLPALPYGLRVDGVSPGPDGLRVSASARDVVLRPAPSGAAGPDN
jgi:LmeA-like phospholipid-binding